MSVKNKAFLELNNGRHRISHPALHGNMKHCPLPTCHPLKAQRERPNLLGNSSCGKIPSTAGLQKLT